jgi:protocatechuate 3,4-dioxygenase alpha subunit
VAALTPFQTVGPFLSIGLRAGVDVQVTSVSGPRIVIRGRLLDGAGQGIPDGVFEWWHPSFSAMQRTLTQDDGAFVLETVKPGSVRPPAGEEQAPHLAVRVLARGVLTQYITRVYFADEAEANAQDRILGLVPEHRRQTLVAAVSGANEYHFDVVVQGENETVFFDV